VYREAARLFQRGELLDFFPSRAAALKNRIIRAAFFRCDPVTSARELIGCNLVWGGCTGKIVETEAYLAEDDEACHTFSRPSARLFVQRNKAGSAYIYFSYGAHWMLNVLVKGVVNGFVLIRAVEPVRGLALMKRRRGIEDKHQLCSGPGKLTKAFDITDRHHEMDLCVDTRHCFARSDNTSIDVVSDARIGISRSTHHPWRFTLRHSEFISHRVKS
jgi:DNA-3-methyladenine glycosylase